LIEWCDYFYVNHQTSTNGSSQIPWGYVKSTKVFAVKNMCIGKYYFLTNSQSNNYNSFLSLVKQHIKCYM